MRFCLLIPVAITLFLLAVIFIKRKTLLGNQKMRWLWICTVLFLSIYLFIVGNAAFFDLYYSWDLARYDLNQNGNFEPSEQTEAQKLAMKKVIGDTGRTFSVIIGLIFATIITLPLFLGGVLYKKICS